MSRRKRPDAQLRKNTYLTDLDGDKLLLFTADIEPDIFDDQQLKTPRPAGYNAYFLDEGFNITSAKRIDAELPLLGGFYKGTDGYFYILTGQENDEEDDIIELNGE